MKNIKIAIIGAGWFGNYHLDNIKKMKGIEIAALVSTNKQRLTYISAKSPKANTYTDYNQMLKSEKNLDAIIVCVPPDSHKDIELFAAKNKINLWIEKPLGISMETINKNAQIIKESGIICAVGYQTRYNLLLDELKDKLQNSIVGSVNIKWFGIMPATPWWREKERSGGQLAEQATHEIDLVRYLFGDVEWVFSQARKDNINDVSNFDVEDSSSSIMKFKSGLIATLQCGCFNVETEAQDEIVIEIYGKDFSAIYRWDQSLTYKTKKGTKTYYFGNEFHYPALLTFLDAVRSGNSESIKSSYSDAVKTFATTYAANISMETGEKINVQDLIKE
jgi:predicted dehydrogenase